MGKHNRDTSISESDLPDGKVDPWTYLESQVARLEAGPGTAMGRQKWMLDITFLACVKNQHVLAQSAAAQWLSVHPLI